MRGQESNLRTRGSKPRISTSRNYPAVGEGRVGLEPTRRCLTNTCSAAELPTQSRVPCGNRTRLSSLEGWYLCRSAKGTFSFLKAEAVGLEPTIPILRDTCFRGRPLIQPDDFPSSSCGDRNRTCVVTVNSRLPVPARTPPQGFPVSVVGFEPTFSCARGTRISMLSHTLIIAHRRWNFVVTTDRPRERKSTQRELNPHLRLGETVRCRYVMGA